MLHIRKNWRMKPRGVLELNMGGTFYNSNLMAFHGHHGAEKIKYPQYGGITVTGTPGVDYSESGGVIVSSSNRYTWGRRATAIAADKLSCLYVGRAVGVSASGSTFYFGQYAISSASSAYDWGVYESFGGDLVGAQCRNSTNTTYTATADSAITWRNNAVIACAFSWDGADLKINVNGSPGSVAVTGNLKDSESLRLGGSWTNQPYFPTSVYCALACAVPGIAWSAPMLKELAENPWQIFQPIKSAIIYSFPSSGNSIAWLAA